ncbi:MAG: SMI1/KNR4 family protein [Acidobacteria bacterium]|nr:SMI1/KNR4 family protein [Acidobacteriota bacterium]
MNSDRLDRIREKLGRLIEKDAEFQTFGSDGTWGGHRYRLEPALSEAALTAFETAHGIRLPAEYREFLNRVGNGGAGPYYGLHGLEKGIREAETYSTEGSEPVKDSFKIPFPLSRKEVAGFIADHDRMIDDGEDDLIRYPEVPDPLTGVVFLSEYGCGWSYCLVVSGEQAGTVWMHGDYLSPIFDDHGQWTFFDWYEDWLDQSLKSLEPGPAEPPKYDADRTIVSYDGWNLKSIPKEVFRCKRLKKLVFSRNGLRKFPTRITRFKELRTLDLSMNPLVEIPDEIGGLANLKRLFLNYNHHRDLPAGLARLENLEELSMYYNYELEAVPPVVARLPKIKTLKFSYSGRLKKVPKDIGRLKTLEMLDLCDCGALARLPASVSELENLKYLYLDNTRIRRLPEGFEKLRNLEALGIAVEDFDWPDAIEKLKRLPKLQWLRIKLEPDYPAAFGELANVRRLTVEQNYMLWHKGRKKLPLPETIGRLSNLEELDLTNNNQAGALPENIGALKNLKTLELGATGIKRFPESLQNLERLEKVAAILDKTGDSACGVLEAEKEKIVRWFPNAKIWIW